MICVHKVWKLIGNNYDVTGKPEKEDILVLEKFYFLEINSYPH